MSCLDDGALARNPTAVRTAERVIASTLPEQAFRGAPFPFARSSLVKSCIRALFRTFRYEGLTPPHHHHPTHTNNIILTGPALVHARKLSGIISWHLLHDSSIFLYMVTNKVSHDFGDGAIQVKSYFLFCLLRC